MKLSEIAAIIEAATVYDLIELRIGPYGFVGLIGAQVGGKLHVVAVTMSRMVLDAAENPAAAIRVHALEANRSLERLLVSEEAQL